MRYAASEKLEIIRTVEQSSLGMRRTLRQIGIPRSTFYNWYDRYVSEGFDGLEDKKPDPGSVWNKVPDAVTEQLVTLALAESDLSPRELAVADEQREPGAPQPVRLVGSQVERRGCHDGWCLL